MRVFIAVNFDEETVRSFRVVQERVRSFTERGTFSAAENLHLTLAFLGETDYGGIPRVENVLDKVCYGRESFTVQFVKTGCFKRGGYRSRSSDEGDLWWIGTGEEKPLFELHKTLSTALWEAGYATENRLYEPHITLVRGMRPLKHFPGATFADDLLPFSGPVRRVSLMKSERSKGKSVYTEIYGQDLTGVK